MAKEIGHLRRVNDHVYISEVFYNCVRFRYKKIRVFGHDLRVPIKYANEFEEKINNIEIALELSGSKYTIESNMTMIEVAIYKDGYAAFTINIVVHHGFSIIDINKKFKPNSKILRVEINRPYAKSTKLIEVYSDNKKFISAIDYLTQRKLI